MSAPRSETTPAPASPASPPSPASSDPLLSVRDLDISFATDQGPARVCVVQGVSFDVHRGETLGLVGESGCGKSVTVKSIMRLVPDPPGRITGGRILLAGEDLVRASERRMRRLRGNRMAMIFQEPMTALNPVLTIGWQIEEALVLHQPELARAERRERVLQMLRNVGIPAPERRLREYPHQLSGGMRQRAMIAMALACNPDILFADEPTTALDVTVQAQILGLLQAPARASGTAVVLITHDLAVVAEICDRVLVMYAGRIVEEASVERIFHAPAHPYTAALLRSIPRRGPKVAGARLAAIPGTVPDPGRPPRGCRFHDRCERAHERCADSEPVLETIAEGHQVRCFSPIIVPITEPASQPNPQPVP
jgi:oligopeptide/dipeptide ABC transporter ATP-binding protein